MKLCLIVPGFSADADDWCIPALRDLVGALAKTNDVTVITLRYPRRQGHYQLFGAEVIALGGADVHGRASLALWRQALATIRTEHRHRRFDLLHAFWATEPGFLATLAGRLLRLPTIVSLAGGELVGLRDLNYGDQLVASQRLKIALTLRLANAVTAGSQALLDHAAPWLRHHSAQHHQRIPLGVDTSLFYPALQRPANPIPALAHVASLVPVKDQATLLHALALTQAQGHPARLLVAGTGPLEPALHSLADNLDLTDSIEWLGAVPHDHLPALYQRSDLFVLSSRHEAQSVAALEAAACGLPIVSTAVGLLPELTPHVALTVPPNDPSALAAALIAILSNPHKQQEMRQAARQAVEQHFGLSHTVSQFAQLYSNLVVS